MVDKNDEESFLDKHQLKQQQERGRKSESLRRFILQRLSVTVTLWFASVTSSEGKKKRKKKIKCETRKWARERKHLKESEGRKWSKWHHSLVVDLPCVCPDIHDLWSIFLSPSFIWFSTWLNQTSFSSRIQCNTFAPWNTWSTFHSYSISFLSVSFTSELEWLLWLVPRVCDEIN